MPKGPAARVLDPVIHPLPGMLTVGPGSINVIIGGKLAWRGVTITAAASLRAAKAASDQTIQAAEAATLAAAGTPGAPAALAAEQTAKATAATTMGATITSSAGGADIHTCATPLPMPPHGPGVVVDGSPTVFINNLAACRQGDTIIEAVGPPDKIAVGCPTVIIGDAPTYASRDDAARAALTYANPLSIAANLENGGMIYQNPDGTFSFTLAGGTDAGFNPTDAPIPPGTTAMGDFHNHGDYSLRNPITGNAIRTGTPALDSYNSDQFSTTDLNGITADGAGNPNYRGYLGTPSGGFQVFDPNNPPPTAF